MAATYKGFSTVNRNKPSYTLRDIDLVKQDILNHFYTRRGERVMMPSFGSDIHNYVMEQMTSENLESLQYEVERVINSEPRVQFLSMDVLESGHLIRIAVELLFTPGDVADTLYLEFTEDQ